nr:hypothetical protein CFP56_16592 [Quercus suber]
MAGFTNALRSQRASIQTRYQRSLLHRMLNNSTHGRRPRDLENAGFEDFYSYTSGRWLWAEEERLQERYKRFNVPGLKLLAAKASGAQSCVSIVKLAEGGFNKVFRLVMDNGSVVIARIPNPNVGLTLKVVASEVATMDFVSSGSKPYHPRQTG